MYHKLNLNLPNRVNTLLFALVSILYIIFNNAYLIDYPTGIHFIRQSDSISFSLYYCHKLNFNLLDIGNLNLNFDNGRTACEFPLFYYLYFLAFQVFGIKFSIIRWTSLFLASFSLFKLMSSMERFLRNSILTTSLAVLIFSSSVLRYYSVNFLPDSLALSFTFIGISCLLNFLHDKNDKIYHLSFLFFSIAALLKIYYGIYLFLAFGLVFLGTKSLSKMTVVFFITSLVTIVLWYCYAIYYNKLYKADYYLTTMKPLWDLSDKSIRVVLRNISEYWYSKYFLPSIFHFFLFCVLTIFFVKRVISNKIKIFLLAGVSLNFIYLIVFFAQFRDHDYYFMPLVPMFLLISFFAIDGITRLFINRIFVTLTTLVVLVIALSGFNHTTINMERRFGNSIDEFSIIKYQLSGVNKYIDSLNVPDEAKFLVVGDNTMNGSLVFLNRFGWTYKSFSEKKESLESNMGKADYLLVLKPSENQIPQTVNNKLKNCEKFTFYSNYLYSLRNYGK